MSETKPAPHIVSPHGLDRLSKIYERLERLETLVKLQGPFMLFIVEDHQNNIISIVVAPDYSSAVSMVSNADNVDCLGRASSIYDSPAIIRHWRMK